MNLLILPPVWSTDPETVQTAYGPSISHLLTVLSRETRSDNNLSRLDVAIVLSSSGPSSETQSRGSLFPRVQKVFQECYTLICSTAARLKIDLDMPGGIDARIFLLDSAGEASESRNVRKAGKRAFCGPLIDIETLIAAHRPYDTLYSVDSDEGDELLRHILSLHRTTWTEELDHCRLPAGISIKRPHEQPEAESRNTRPAKMHTSVAVGGTFDHLHIGHKLLLSATAFLLDPEDATAALDVTRTLTIGVTGDELLVNKKYADQLESWEERQERTADFLESILVFASELSVERQPRNISKPGPNGKYVQVHYGSHLTINYVQISDPFGPTITEESISALAISAETRAGGKAVNDKRAEKEWSDLEIFEVDVLDAGSGNSETASKETFESKISSTEIRRRMQKKRKENI